MYAFEYQRAGSVAEAAKMLGKKHGALNFKEGPNLLPNSGFEELAADMKTPVGWKQRDYGTKPGNAGAQWGIVINEKMVHSGKHGFRVITREDADTSFFADVVLKDLRFGTERTVLSAPGTNSGVAFSHDGTRLALSMSYEGDTDIYVSTLTGSRVKRVTEARSVEFSPAWSPDGSRLKGLITDFSGGCAGGVDVTIGPAAPAAAA